MIGRQYLNVDALTRLPALRAIFLVRLHMRDNLRLQHDRTFVQFVLKYKGMLGGEDQRSSKILQSYLDHWNKIVPMK